MPISWVNGLPLFYRIVGKPGSNPPILLIHGLASSQRDWLLQLPPLCRERQVVLVDLRGHGRTGYNSQFQHSGDGRRSAHPDESAQYSTL